MKFAPMNYHYLRYPIKKFLDKVERSPFNSIDLYCSAPQLNLFDYPLLRLIELKKEIEAHHLSVMAMTPENCVYPVNFCTQDDLTKYGDDEVAACVQDTLKEIGIDDSHCRRYEGENGFALVTLKETDRVFLGSNKGGIAKEHDFGFTKEDLEYIKGFHLIYTNLNSYIEKELPVLYQTGVPVAYDFSTRWTDEYLKEICPYVTVAIMSCAHLTDEEREKEMRKAQSYGVKVVLGTIGEDGSYVLYNDKILYAPAVHADDVIDTMGAGDSYFSAFLCSLLETSKEGKIVEGTDEEMAKRLQTAMGKGAVFAAKVCALEGAFGYGVPILGKTTV